MRPSIVLGTTAPQAASDSKWVVLKEWAGGTGHTQTEKFVATAAV
jgi:hypothetical protein